MQQEEPRCVIRRKGQRSLSLLCFGPWRARRLLADKLEAGVFGKETAQIFWVFDESVIPKEPEDTRDCL